MNSDTLKPFVLMRLGSFELAFSRRARSMGFWVTNNFACYVKDFVSDRAIPLAI